MAAENCLFFFQDGFDKVLMRSIFYPGLRNRIVVTCLYFGVAMEERTSNNAASGYFKLGSL